MMEQLEGRFPEAAACLESAAPDILAFRAFLKAVWCWARAAQRTTG